MNQVDKQKDIYVKCVCKGHVYEVSVYWVCRLVYISREQQMSGHAY